MTRSNRELTRLSSTPSSTVHLGAAFLVTALLAACHSDSRPRGEWGGSTAAPQQPTAEPPAPGPDNPHAVSGQVFDAYSGGLADTDVGFFVETSRWGRGRSARTDQSGQFLTYLPDSRISAFVSKAGLPQPEYVQPCAVQAEVRGSLDLQIEVMSSSTLQSLSPPRPQFVRGATLTGTIFETINGVRTPVMGAELWAEEYDDLAVATTLSDFQGAYFLCNLPRKIGLYVSKPEFVLTYVAITPEETPIVEIELKRR